MDISYMLKMEDGYYHPVVAREYLGGWSESQPPKQGTSQNVAKFCYKDVIFRFRTLESVVVYGGEENKECTNLLLRRYNIRKIIVTL